MEKESLFLSKLNHNPLMAHSFLFRHRHKNATPDFHKEIILECHGQSKRLIVEAFRGAAKSTIAEEVIILRSLFRRHRNCIVIGSSCERAVERLRSVKHELEANEDIHAAFGYPAGATWTESRIVLGNGVAVQAYGRGQSLRGAKHLDWRPDFCLVDDLEEEDSVRTPEARERSLSWVFKVLLPSLAPEARVVMIGTPLDPECVIETLRKDAEWKSLVYPVEHLDASGERASSWPERFPLGEIDATRGRYERTGQLREYMQEYMCKAEEESAKAFAGEMRVEPQARSWQPVYAFYDPARTVGPKSAHTGVAVWSWVGNRLIVWDAYGKFWKPDEIIADMFRVQEAYAPVEIGMEKTGLSEFVEQPVRAEMRRRGVMLPYRGYEAPKGKLDFIKGLQPFFKAGEVIFAKELPELRSQLLNFPSGRIDVPNALAYALKMRPGLPVYEDFGAQHIDAQALAYPGEDAWMAVHAEAGVVAAALVQAAHGRLLVLKDWVMEGEAGERLPELVESGRLALEPAGWVAPSVQFDQYRNAGLAQAAKKAGVTLRRGREGHEARELIRQKLRASKNGRPAFAVSPDARWTLNALSGGYCYRLEKNGKINASPAAGAYRVLMEAIEAYAGLLAGRGLTDDFPVHYATTADGRRYISSRPTVYR